MTEPLACTAVWRAVMEAAGYRCQCTGQCCTRHTRTEGRCPLVHDGYGGKGGPLVRLLAAPADAATPERVAVTLPASRLRAWCPQCRTEPAASPARPLRLNRQSRTGCSPCRRPTSTRH